MASNEATTPASADITHLPPGSSLGSVLGVPYVHVKTGDTGDLHLTKHGLPLLEFLKPENWYDTEWFEKHRIKLEGTSTVYKVCTKPIGGRSLELVVKYSRVGQDVPLQTSLVQEVLDADFNSPFEEFQLVEELRAGQHGPAQIRISAMYPLAIYIPPERMQLWQTGRSECKIAYKVARHPGIEIDILRHYILIYAWIPGLDAYQAHEHKLLSEDEVRELNERATAELRQKGYWVLDMKPKHLIVTPTEDGVERRDGTIVYQMVDFELLQRTPEYEALTKSARRSDYLIRQRNRFCRQNIPFPDHLCAAQILGVDYVFGHAESTGGKLWVVGQDPKLFDYFLPERWRKTPQIQLSPDNQIYYTHTKDNIHLVWRVSRVGESPDQDPEHPHITADLRRYGFNSPYEEFAYALQLRERGVQTIYARAIYVTGHKSCGSTIVDDSRYRSHAHITMPHGERILEKNYDAITVWGYWNGPDEWLADRDGQYYTGLSATQCHAWDLLDDSALARLLQRKREHLREVGFEAPNLKSDHLILSLDPKGVLKYDAKGNLEARVCNFQFVRPLS